MQELPYYPYGDTDPQLKPGRPEDDLRDPWGRPPSDPWYNIPPNPNQPIPYAPGYGPDNLDGGPAPAAPPPPPSGAPTTPSPTQRTFQPIQYNGPTFGDYSWYTAPPSFNFSRPEFSYQDFKAPTFDEAYNDPGYQFGMKEGERALEQSASGRGVLRTGGTLKDILNYGRSAAAQQYGSVYDRNYRTYDMNRRNAFENYTTNYNNAFNLAKEQYAPSLLDWTARNNLQKQASDDYVKNSMDLWKYAMDDAYKYFDAGSRPSPIVGA